MQVSILRLDMSQPGAAEQLTALRAKLSVDGDVVSAAGRQKTLEVFGEPLSPAQAVDRICGEVRQRGFAAVLEYTRKLDGAELTPDTLRVSAEELAAAHAAADPEFLRKIRSIRQGILRFQLAVLHSDVRVDLEEGRLPAAPLPAAAASGDLRAGRGGGLSVDRADDGRAGPGGRRRADWPSWPRRRRSAPTTRDLLATCHELGISEVYRLGGAQAVAALAYGVEGMPRVDKIVGPGNLFVALAKKHVYGEVDIDSIAGPSEVVVIVDDSTRAEYTACDLIAQAEHAPGASILIGWSDGCARRDVERASAGSWAKLERGRSGPAEPGRVRGGDPGPRSRTKPAGLADEIAPEHLHIATRERRGAGRQDPPRRGDVPGQLHAGGAGRLCGRAVARAAHQRHGPVCQRPVGQRFPPVRQRAALRPRRDDARLLAGRRSCLANKEGLTAHRGECGSVETDAARPID